MENQLGHQAKNRLKEERKRRWQILFVDDHGNMVTVKWFKPVSIAALSILLLSVVLCITLAVLLHSTKSDNRNYISKVEAYKQQIHSIQTEKDILMAKLVIAESKLNGQQNPLPLEPETSKNNPIDLKKKQNSAPEKKEPEKTPPYANKNKDKEMKSNPTKNIPKNKNINPVKEDTGDDDIINGVDIDNLVFSHEPEIDLLRTKFIVKNTSETSDAVSGYIFIVLKPDDSEPNDWFTIPSTGLVSGRPAFPKRGQYFKIHRFKTVNFKASRQKNPESYKKATIYIFSEDNALLLKKTVPVKFEKT